MAVPLSPLNKREVLKYIQIWCRCGYITASHLPVPISDTSGAVTRMTAWADSRYGIESGWKILGERSVAVPLSPLNKREVLKTPYIQIWCRCGSLIEGLTSFHLSV